MRSVHICIGCQIVPVIKGNNKNAIVESLILLNNDIWPLFTMHPLHINMHLAQASEACYVEVKCAKRTSGSYNMLIR